MKEYLLHNKNWISEEYNPELVSVIIPTYNRTTLLEEAVKSVQKQTYRPIECIVVDDGSSNNTDEIIANLQAQMNDGSFTLIYIKQKNAGAPAARNNGARNSKGEYIQFFDSDDLLYPDKFEKQVAFLKSNPQFDGVFGDWEQGTLEHKKQVEISKHEDIILQFYCERVVHTLSLLFKRSIIQKIGPWDEALRRNQEVDFHLRGVLAGGNFEHIPMFTGLWRSHGEDRIVNISGADKLIQFHFKWEKVFNEIGLLNGFLKKKVADCFFVTSLDITPDKKAIIYKGLQKTLEVNPNFDSLSTKRMKLYRKFLGPRLSVKLWYKQYLKNK